MAEIKLTVIGSDVGTLESTLTLSPEHSDRLLAFLAATYGTDEEGNPRTPQQMIEAYWQGVSAGTIANVYRWEQENAAKAAREAVEPIEVVPS